MRRRGRRGKERLRGAALACDVRWREQPAALQVEAWRRGWKRGPVLGCWHVGDVTRIVDQITRLATQSRWWATPRQVSGGEPMEWKTTTDRWPLKTDSLDS